MNRANIVTSTRMAGRVSRYHTWPTIQTQTVADHTWQVLRLLLTLFPEEANPQVIDHVVWHDVAEVGTGDLPFPVKSAHPDLRAALSEVESEVLDNMGVSLPDLSERERKLVKLCDLLEMFEFGMDERLMGNCYAEPIVVETRAAALVLAAELREVEIVTKFLGMEP